MCGRAARGAALLLAGTALGGTAAHGQSATWIGTNGDYHAAGNWSTGSVPSFLATFSNLGTPEVNITAPASIETFGFTSNSPPTTITIGNSGALTFIVGGVWSDSTNQVTFNINGSLNNPGQITFDGAGSSRNVDGGKTLLNVSDENRLVYSNNSYAGEKTVISLQGSNSVLDFINNGGDNLEIGGLVSGSSGQIRMNDAGLTLIDNSETPVTFAGTISGNGRLQKLGTSTYILTGDNTYAGITNILEGAIQVGDGTSTGSLGTGNIVIQSGGGGMLIFNRADDIIVANNIQGGGRIVKLGDNTVTLTGGGGKSTGTISIVAGTLEFGNGSTIGTGAITNDGTLAVNRSDSFTISAAIGGTGNLHQIGSGTTILNGANTYQGTTTIAGGILQLGGAAGSLGAGAVTNNGVLQFNRSNEHTVGNDISGTGSISQTGTGTAILTGTNTYQGTTTIASGSTLQVGNGQTTGTLGQGAVTNNGTLRFSRSNDMTVQNGISGSGSVQQAGSGTTILGGNNSYTGGTTVTAGTLRIATGATLASTGSLTVNGGTFDLNNSSLSMGTLAGSGGIIALGSGALTTSSASDSNVASTITGTGRLTKANSGLLTLSGENTYSGGTTITGGAISISADHNLGQANGGLAFNGANTRLQTTATMETARNIGLNTSGILDVGVNTVFTVNGNVTGAGGLSKSGAGTLVLAGNNNFAGQLAISNGTVEIGSSANVGSSTISIGDSTTFRTTGTFLLANSVVFNGNGGRMLEVAAGTALALNGTLGGSGGFTKSGAGTLTLTGTNTYLGATNISEGTVVVSSDDNLGAANASLFMSGGTLRTTGSFSSGRSVSLEDSGTFEISTGAVTLNGAISEGDGPGRLTKTGGGTLVLTAGNSYSGGTTVSAGTLQGTTTSLQGNINNNAAVTFDQLGSGTYAGNMSGAGSLTIQGGGTVTLTGVNSYSGGTSVLAGTIVGSTASLQGDILNNAAVVFDQVGTGTYAGNMSGSGSLTLQGGGTVTLAGTNSYSGGTSVLSGTLIGNTASLQGNILNNGAVVFNQTGSGTYAGNMSGSGSMTLQGGGMLVMTGTNTYSGATTVDASTLVVNGSLASTVTVNNGGVLAGSGSIGAFVSTGGILAPGNSIGTMTVNGNFTQNGGTYQVEVNAQGQSDKVNVNGTATINGAAVQVLAQPGNYATSTTYTILTATGGVTGAYTGVTSNYAFLTPSLSYDANNVFLTLALQGNAFSGFGGNTVNQRAVGYALDQSYANASGDFATVIGALANLSTTQAGPALNTISGQPYADFGSFNVANTALFMNALGQQMALARGGSGSGQRQALAQACDVAACDAASPFSVWGSVLGGVGSVQGDGNSSTFTYNVGGTAAGIDYRMSPNALVGIGAGYTNGTQWVDSFQGKGWSNTVSVAAYGSFTQWGLYLDALAGYAYSNNQMQRQISIPGLQPRTASGSTGANQFLGQVETGYAFGIYAPAAATITPFARFQASSINQAAFSEWGADSLSLNVAQQTTTSLRSTLGADLAAAIGLGDARTLDVGLRLGWMHEYANTARPMTAAFAGAPSANFTVYGATPQRDAAVIGFQASTNVADSAQIYLRYDADVGSGTDNHALNLGMRIRW